MLLGMVPSLFLAYHNLLQYHLGRRDFRPFSGDYVDMSVQNVEKNNAMYPPVPDSLLFDNVLDPGILLGVVHGSGGRPIGIPYDKNKASGSHLVIFGSPGSGKSTSIMSTLIAMFMRAEINHCDTTYQFIAVDIKNELWKTIVFLY